MDKETFQRIIKIDGRIKNLDYVIASIVPVQDFRLSYVNKDGRALPEWQMKYISELLDKHDLMIREEIQKELESLEKQIEEL